MLRFFGFREKKQIIIGALFTVFFAVLLITSLILRNQFTKKLVNGAKVDIAEDTMVISDDLRSGPATVFSQTFRPVSNGLTSIGIRMSNVSLENTNIVISLYDGLRCLYETEVSPDLIADRQYYSIWPGVPLKAWRLHELRITCSAADDFVFLGTESLLENDTLSCDGVVCDGELDLRYEYWGYSYLRVICMIIFCCAGICLTWVKNDFFRNKLLGSYVVLPVAAFVCLWLVERLSQNNLFTMSPMAIFVNWILIAAAMFLLMAVCNHSAVAGMAVSGSLFIFSLINYFTLKYRGTVLVPADVLYSGKTAADVLENYDFTPDSRILITAAFLLLLLLFLWKTNSQNGKWGRIGTVIVTVLMVLCISRTTFHPETTINLHVEPNLWDPTGQSKTIGFLQNMLTNIHYLEVKEPDGYTAEAAEALYSTYSEAEIPVNAEGVRPNVVVIMAEAMSDLRNYGPLETSEDPLANLHCLAEDGKTGFCVVPVFGGGTSCSEFEFLTGFSMRFLGGFAPYQQYVHEETENLVSDFAELDEYGCLAVHSYGANNWGRKWTYPLLGFSRFVSWEEEEFNNAKTSRAWIADETMMDVVAELYDQEERALIFGVTMECHGGYTTEGFENTVFVKNMSQNYADAEQYLTCLHSTDQAIGTLIDRLAASEEPTIVLVFGDHLPTLSDAFYHELEGKAGDVSAAHQLFRRYETPYVLWSNYDVDFSAVPDLISINFMYPYLLQAAGMELDDYERFLYSISREYPVVSQYGIVDTEGNLCDVATDAVCAEMLRDYSILQYHRLRGN